MKQNANDAHTGRLSAFFKNIAVDGSLEQGMLGTYMPVQIVTKKSRIMRKKRHTIDNERDYTQTPATTGPESVAEPASCFVDNQKSQPANLQPSGLLNHEAMRGKFSLLSILSTNQDQSSPIVEEASTFPTHDIVRAGLVSQSIAEFLFSSFMNILNPYISQLDPNLHTFSHVRQKSAFLLSSILAASAKMFNPGLYKPLHQHAEDLLVDSFRRGEKSIETAQAILILTYWKEPEDTRSWVTLGYVIRMCIDLGWHKLRPPSRRERERLTEMQVREARNIERTWFVLFVMSLQTSKPWMIERNSFFESIEVWCKDATATDSDNFLGAFVTIRLLTSEVFRLLTPRQTDSGQNTYSLLTILSNRIDEWESKWLNMCSDSESCHGFLIQFYGTHLRLQLYSLPLQEVLGSAQHDVTYSMEALWASYSSAIKMLKLVAQYSQFLYFAQDSIHVMTAYAAAFLIKLLLSAPSSIVREIEETTMETMRTAAAVFAQQSAPADSSCFLQSRFLFKIMSNYDGLRRNNTEPNGSAGRIFDDNNVNTTENSENLPHQIGVYLTPYRQTNANIEREPGSAERIDCILTGGDAWEDFLANAGFSIQDGYFFS
ncbi:hypothetical protein PISL3812_09162 [Talaromyces islandicus]|uniref:Xylanolytic transcriptional activator regulatory domain-containing protein n=1 Tax=Talaromyces islandicus TaxID=28573 RepID=A0A0U1M919_TALIS|nr:hypothetical protein PISL3812_09162 [Talaromyces islandicus]